MKHTLAILTLLLTPTLALMAGKPAVTQTPPAVSISCSICNPGETIIIIGSGFAHKASVNVAISGAWGSSTPVRTDNKGNFTVTYPIGQYMPVGEYDLTVTGGSASVSTSFEIQ